MSQISGTFWKRFNNGANCPWACAARAIPKGMINKIGKLLRTTILYKWIL